MPGSGAEKREDREVIFRISGGEHIQVIAQIPAFPVGIPSDVAVRLAVDSVTPTVPDAIFQAVVGTLFPFPCGSVDRDAVPGNGKTAEVVEPVLYRTVKEKGFKDVIKPFTGSTIYRLH